MAVTIRDATVSDTDAIAGVHVASWRWAYAGIVPDRVLEELSLDGRRQLWRGWFATGEERASLLVAVEDVRVVGFCGVGPSRDHDAGPGTGEVRTLYLLETAAGRGIGRDLFGEGWHGCEGWATAARSSGCCGTRRERVASTKRLGGRGMGRPRSTRSAP